MPPPAHAALVLVRKVASFGSGSARHRWNGFRRLGFIGWFGFMGLLGLVGLFGFAGLNGWFLGLRGWLGCQGFG